jgi:hypothetical protein
MKYPWLTLALALLAPAAFAASTTTVVNDVAPDMKTLYRQMEKEVDPRIHDGDYLGALGAARGYLERQQDADLIAFLLDVQSQWLAAAGDYEGALVYMSRAANIGGRAEPPRRYDAAWGAARREVKWREPADVLREAAKTHNVLMISEAHHVPETRALGRELLPMLRALGFEYFAMETLKYPVPDRVDRVAISTSPGAAAGYYFMEPQSAGLARDALKLGFKLVAYEDETTGGGDREEIQARNLYDRILKDKPAAKVVVWAGFGHVYKRTSKSMGKAMAGWIWELTGHEPFSLFQVADALDTHYADAPFYAPLVIEAPDRPRKALVLMTKRGLFPALDKIKDSGVDLDKEGRPLVDGYIVHPPFERHAPGRLRPAWVAGGRRELSGVVEGATKGPLFVQAFPAAEGVRSSPADQMTAESGGRFELWLPEGSYLLRARDEHGAILAEGKSVVGAAGAKAVLVVPAAK